MSARHPLELGKRLLRLLLSKATTSFLVSGQSLELGDFLETSKIFLGHSFFITVLQATDLSEVSWVSVVAPCSWPLNKQVTGGASLSSVQTSLTNLCPKRNFLSLKFLKISDCALPKLHICFVLESSFFVAFCSLFFP